MSSPAPSPATFTFVRFGNAGKTFKKPVAPVVSSSQTTTPPLRPASAPPALTLSFSEALKLPRSLKSMPSSHPASSTKLLALDLDSQPSSPSAEATASEDSFHSALKLPASAIEDACAEVTSTKSDISLPLEEPSKDTESVQSVTSSFATQSSNKKTLSDADEVKSVISDYMGALVGNKDIEELKFMKPQKTPGTNLLCALYALAGSIAFLQHPDEHDHLKVKYHEFILFLELEAVLLSPEYEQMVAAVSNEASKADLSHTSFLSDAAINTVLELYCEKHNLQYRLGIVSQAKKDEEKTFPFIFKPEPEDAPLVWIFNRWGVHWESMRPSLREEDISSDGRALDLEDAECTVDPRHTGIDPTTQEEDAAAQNNTNAPILLRDPKRTDPACLEVRAFRPFHAAQVLLGDGVALPDINAKELTQFRSVSLSFSAGGTSINPHIQLRLTLYRSHKVSRPTLIWQSRLTIPLGRLIRKKSDLDLIELEAAADINHGLSRGVNKFVVSVPDDLESRSFDVDIQFDAAVAGSLHIPDDIRKRVKLTGEEQRFYDLLNGLTQGREKKNLKLRVFLSERESDDRASGEQIEFLQLMRKIESMVPFKSVPYAPFLRMSGYPQITANNCKPTRVRVEDGSPHMPVLATPEFLDCIEAEVQLGYDAENEALEEELKMKQYERDEHFVRFIMIGEHVVALLNLSSTDSFFDARHALEPGTEVILQWTMTSRPTPQRALFFVADDIFNFGTDARVILVSKKKRAPFFRGIAVAPSDIADAERIPVSVEIKSVNVAYKRRIHAIHTIFDAKTGRQDLWDLLLNHNPKTLPVTNPFEDAGVDQETASRAIQDSINIKDVELNAEQKAVLLNTTKLRAGVQTIQACGGMGKTMLECLLAHTYDKVGITPIFMAPTNTAVSAACNEYMKMFPDRPKPLRVPATNRDEDLVVSEVLKLMKHETKHKKRDGFGFTVVDAIIELTKTEPEHRRKVIAQYSDGQDADTNEPIYYGSPVDMVEEFARYYNKATTDIENPFRDWEDEDKKQYEQSFRVLKANVIAHAPILACTTSISALPLVHQNAGIAGTGKIALLIDEAARDREADTLVPIVSFKNKIVGIHLIGDIEQGSPVCVSSPDYNEFYKRGRMALMTRLVDQGFPTQRLTTQYRMSSHLFRFPNRFTYEGRLKTAAIANVPITPAIQDALASILEYVEPEDKKLVNLHYIELNDAYVRSSTRSHSRCNLENLQWVFDAIQKLLPVFGQDMKKQVMIITPYRLQRELYSAKFLTLRRENPEITPAHIPDVRSVDGSQSHEAMMVIFDLVCVSARNRGDVGFLFDDQRSNVGFTRAKKVLWMVGGNFEGRLSELKSMDDKDSENPFEPKSKGSLCGLLEYIRSLRRNQRAIKLSAAPYTGTVRSDIMMKNAPGSTGGGFDVPTSDNGGAPQVGDA